MKKIFLFFLALCLIVFGGTAFAETVAAEARVSELNQQLAANLEPTASVKNAILLKQGELIDLIYEEQNASDKARALKAEIDEKNAVLRKRRERLNVLSSLAERES